MRRATLVALVVLALGFTTSPAFAGPPTAMDSYVRADRATLESLYRGAQPGAVPTGFLPGRAIFDPGSKSTPRRAATTGLLWKGKVFTDGMMVNKLAFGAKAVKAEVFVGESWFDGRPSIIMDYANTSKLFPQVRDEIREVEPGVYLGLTYLRKCPTPELANFFVLDARGCR